jgi:hypothetical protein
MGIFKLGLLSALSKNGLYHNNGNRVLTERYPVNKWLKAQGIRHKAEIFIMRVGFP